MGTIINTMLHEMTDEYEIEQNTEYSEARDALKRELFLNQTIIDSLRARHEKILNKFYESNGTLFTLSEMKTFRLIALNLNCSLDRAIFDFEQRIKHFDQNEGLFKKASN